MEAFGVTGAAEHVLGRTIIMADRLALDIPHRLGRAEARQKLENKLGHIVAALPGGSLNSHHWEGDTLFLDIAVLGQRIASELEVLDDRVHAEVDLPPFGFLFADRIKAELNRVGTDILA